MDSILSDVNWTAVTVGAFAAWMLGALWFSPKMFGLKWMKAVGMTEDKKCHMAHAMIAQAAGTFLLAWLVGISAAANSLQMAALIALTMSAAIAVVTAYSAGRRGDCFNSECSEASKYSSCTFMKGYCRVLGCMLSKTHTN